MTAKMQTKIAALRRQALCNTAKARDSEASATREMKASVLSANPGFRVDAERHRDDARLHLACARRQRRQAVKLEAERRDAEGKAA